MIAALKKAITSYIRDWEYRLIYRSHVVRDIVGQIEWRLSLNHSSSPDTEAAYKLVRELQELTK